MPISPPRAMPHDADGSPRFFRPYAAAVAAPALIGRTPCLTIRLSRFLMPTGCLMMPPRRLPLMSMVSPRLNDEGSREAKKIISRQADGDEKNGHQASPRKYRARIGFTIGYSFRFRWGVDTPRFPRGRPARCRVFVPHHAIPFSCFTPGL